MRTTARWARERTAIAAAALIAAAATANPADAQAPPPPWAQARGFSLGLQGLTSAIGAEDPAEETNPDGLFVDEVGHGVTLNLGYTFTPAFHLRLSTGIARHETTQEAVEAFFNTVSLEAHWRFLPHERARPYLLGGLGGAFFGLDTDTFDSETRGGVAVLGVGLLYSLTRHLVLDFNTRLDLINWDKVKVTRQLPGGASLEVEAPLDDEGSAWKLQLGLAWEF